MTNLLTANQAAIQAKITDLDARISREVTRLRKPGTTELNKYGNALASLRASYPVSHFVFATAALLKFPEEALGIRDATPTDTCTKPSPSAACVERTIVSIYSWLLLCPKGWRKIWTDIWNRSIVYTSTRIDQTSLLKTVRQYLISLQ